MYSFLSNMLCSNKLAITLLLLVTVFQYTNAAKEDSSVYVEGPNKKAEIEITPGRMARFYAQLKNCIPGKSFFTKKSEKKMTLQNSWFRTIAFILLATVIVVGFIGILTNAGHSKFMVRAMFCGAVSMIGLVYCFNATSYGHDNYGDQQNDSKAEADTRKHRTTAKWIVRCLCLVGLFAIANLFWGFFTEQTLPELNVETPTETNVSFESEFEKLAKEINESVARHWEVEGNQVAHVEGETKTPEMFSEIFEELNNMDRDGLANVAQGPVAGLENTVEIAQEGLFGSSLSDAGIQDNYAATKVMETEFSGLTEQQQEVKDLSDAEFVSAEPTLNVSGDAALNFNWRRLASCEPMTVSTCTVCASAALICGAVALYLRKRWIAVKQSSMIPMYH